MLNIEDFKVGTEVEAKDFGNKWLRATVIQIDAINKRVKVHYIGKGARFDEWISLNKESIRLVDQDDADDGEQTEAVDYGEQTEAVDYGEQTEAADNGDAACQSNEEPCQHETGEW